MADMTPTPLTDAETWDLPSWCRCPDDCDCGGTLVCRVCAAHGRPHVEGQEGHADLAESLAAKRRLRDDQGADLTPTPLTKPTTQGEAMTTDRVGAQGDGPADGPQQPDPREVGDCSCRWDVHGVKQIAVCPGHLALEAIDRG